MLADGLPLLSEVSWLEATMSMCRESRSGVGLSLGWLSDINSVGDGERLPDFDRAECIEVGEGVHDSAHKIASSKALLTLSVPKRFLLQVLIPSENCLKGKSGSKCSLGRNLLLTRTHKF